MDDELKVIVGNRGIRIRGRLLNTQDAWDNLDGIKDLHRTKLIIYQSIDNTDDKDELRSFSKQLTAIEFKLQELWGFPQDIKFHKFWDTPKCRCPRIDNEDSYPFGYYGVSGDCPLHGGR